MVRHAGLRKLLPSLSSKTPAVEATLLWLFVFEFALLVLLPGSWREEIVAAGFAGLLLVAWKQRHFAVQSAGLLWLGVCALAFWMSVQPFLAVHSSSIGWKGGVVLLASFGAAAALPMLNRDGRHDRALRYAFDAFEYFIVAQLVVSFFSGIGEFHGYRTGSVRAFGFLSDSVSPIVGFFIVRNAMEHRHVRCFAAAFALAVTGGKAALGITLATFIVLLLLAGGRQHWLPTRNGLLALLGAYFCVQVAIALEVPPNQFYKLSLTEEEKRISQIELRSLRELRSIEPGEVGTLPQVLLALSSEVSLGFAQAAANRMLSYAAALEIIRRYPLVGAGFNRSHDYIPRMVRLNPGGINILFVDPAIAWGTVTALHNPSLLVFAELGLIGFILFWIVCIGILAVFWNTRYHMRTGPAGPEWWRRSLLVAASAWGTTFVLLQQTTGWIEPGHPQLVFLALCVGVAIAAQSRRTTMHREGE
jgi:O-Antigen ligase